VSIASVCLQVRRDEEGLVGWAKGQFFVLLGCTMRVDAWGANAEFERGCIYSALALASSAFFTSRSGSRAESGWRYEPPHLSAHVKYWEWRVRI